MAPWVHWEAGADPSCPLVKAGSILDKFPVDHEVWKYSQVFTLAHLIQLPSRCNRTALSVIASVVIWSLNSKLTEKKKEISVNLVLVPALVGVSTPASPQFTLLGGKKKGLCF